MGKCNIFYKQLFSAYCVHAPTLLLTRYTPWCVRTAALRLPGHTVFNQLGVMEGCLWEVITGFQRKWQCKASSMVLVMLKSVRNTYTNYGLSVERTLPEIMIELLSRLMESENNVIGDAAFTLGEQLWYPFKKVREDKKKILNDRQTLLGACSEMHLYWKKC